MERKAGERKPSRLEVARVGRPLVAIAMEKVREGRIQKGFGYRQVAVFLKDNRYIKLTDTSVSREGREYVSAGDVSSGLLIESFLSHGGQVTGPELSLSLPRAVEDKHFPHPAGVTTYAQLGIMAVIIEELRVAQGISIDEFDKTLKTYYFLLRRKNGKRR